MSDSENRGETGESGAHAAGQAAPRKMPVTTAQRIVLQDRALDLKLAGQSYRKIAELLSNPRIVAELKLPVGFTVGRVMAWRLVDKALEERRKKLAVSVDKYREIQVAQCEDIIRMLWPKRDVPRTADAINRQQVRLARLLGLDEPEKLEVHDKREEMTQEEAVAQIERAGVALERARRSGKLRVVEGGKATGTDGASAPTKEPTGGGQTT